jgi:hypothetical protein
VSWASFCISRVAEEAVEAYVYWNVLVAMREGGPGFAILLRKRRQREEGIHGL